jgi:integrase
MDPQYTRSWLAAALKRLLAPSSVIDMCNHLVAGLKVLQRDPKVPQYTPATMIGLIDARDAIQRSLPYHTRRQAHPATRADVATLLESCRRTSPTARLRVALMWWALARWSDADRLWAKDVVHMGGNWWRIRWRLTKTSQKGVVRLVTIRLPPQISSELQKLVRSQLLSHKNSPLFPPLSYTAFTTWLKTHNKKLTTHSFRRGGIQTALDADVSEKDVMVLSGHKTVESLLTYADRIGRKSTKALHRMASVLA